MSEILPSSTGLSFAKEARDLLIDLCVEFISLVSSEANEISEKESKKTIACDHITQALERLGFADYVPAVLEAAAEHKEVQKVLRTVIISMFSRVFVFIGKANSHQRNRDERRKQTSSSSPA